MPSLRPLLTCLCAFGALVTSPAMAQAPRSGAGGASAEVLQQFQLQYQKAAADRSALQAENAKLKQDLDAANAKLAASAKQSAALKTGSTSSKAALAAAQDAAHTYQEALAQSKTRLQELVQRFINTTATLSGVETERAQLRQQLTASLARYDICAQRNYELYEETSEVLDKLEHQGFFSAVARSEPFTRLERTRIENLVDDYRERALELRAPKPTSAAAPATLGTPAAAPSPDAITPAPAGRK